MYYITKLLIINNGYCNLPTSIANVQLKHGYYLSQEKVLPFSCYHRFSTTGKSIVADIFDELIIKTNVFIDEYRHI
jgi:hypothetical protein